MIFLQTLMIHQGKTSRFVWDKSLETENRLSKEETNEILQEIELVLRRDNEKYIYYHGVLLLAV